MRRWNIGLAGGPVQINRVETSLDLDEFRDFIESNKHAVGFDTETTGLDIYSPGFRVRLAQFGNLNTSYIIPVEYGWTYSATVAKALRQVDHIAIQNASFDLQVVDKHLGIPMEHLWPKVTDTKIMASTIDPRRKEQGGIGTKLEDLVEHYIGGSMASEVKGSMKKLAAQTKCKIEEVWEKVDLDNEDYNIYAGCDPIFAARLVGLQLPNLYPGADEVVELDHKVAEVTSYIMRLGVLLDLDYTKQLSERLGIEADGYSEFAEREYGLESVNAPAQVVEVFQDLGVDWKKDRNLNFTDAGNPQCDDDALTYLANPENGYSERVQTLCEYVKKAKRAKKWKSAYADNFLLNLDENGRVHPTINPLEARTTRMSITNPALQTLPSGDWMIRRCWIAEEGHVFTGNDYKNQELRILAALSGDPVMLDAFARDEALHMITAKAAFGPHVVKDTLEYKLAKNTSFTLVYGGTAKTVARKYGVKPEKAQKAFDGFYDAYKFVKPYQKQVQDEVRQCGYITNPTGRRLPVDKGKEYAGLNYKIQSTGADVTKRGIIRAHEEGWTPYLRLPVHDENVGSMPAEHAEWGVRELGRLMAEPFGPVMLDTDASVGKRSWGSLKMSEEERRLYEAY